METFRVHFYSSAEQTGEFLARQALTNPCLWKTQPRIRRGQDKVSIQTHEQSKTRADKQPQSFSDGIEKIDGMPLDPKGDAGAFLSVGDSMGDAWCVALLY